MGGGRLVVILVLGTMACIGQRTSNRQTLATRLPGAGMGVGSPEAQLVVVEFGSLTCPFCKEFHDSLYPEIAARWLESGRAQYRYVGVDSGGTGLETTAWLECAVPTLGFDSALRIAFEATIVDSVGAATVPAASQAFPASAACLDRARQGRLEEARIAGAIHIRTVPTFLVGTHDAEGRVVGWVVEGYYEERLLETLGQAAKLIGVDPGPAKLRQPN